MFTKLGENRNMFLCRKYCVVTAHNSVWHLKTPTKQIGGGMAKCVNSRFSLLASPPLGSSKRGLTAGGRNKEKLKK